MASSVMRWDPFRDLMGIQGELNRLFGRTYAGDGGVESAWMPPLDVSETQDRFEVTLELPGIDPADVDVSVEDSVLTVQGERKLGSETDQESFHRIERRYGRFVRSLSLPSTADAERIEATFDKGVLSIRVPKVEQAKPKKITVKAVG